ncbi:MAG: hypothetical protein SGARI_003095, partial [Bacillariaceae sp.]
IGSDDDISCIGSEDLAHEGIDDDEKQLILEDHPELAQADALLKQELDGLSPQERKEIKFDVQGLDNDGSLCCSHSLDDDQGKIQGLLQPLSEALDNLSFTTPTYDLAKAVYSSYIKEKDFCTKFLRAEGYNVEKAAIRLNRYLEVMFEFFGPDALIRRIVMTDLNKDELALLKSGIFQAIAGRDWSGRRILSMDDANLPSNLSVDNVARVYLYVSQNLSDDAVTQRRGLVSISNMTTTSSNTNGTTNHLIDNASWRMAVRKIMGALPVKIAAVHVVAPEPKMTGRYKALVLLSMGCQLRPRVRFHVGARRDVRRSLNKYGLPVDQLSSYRTHQKWITMMQSKEKTQQNVGVFAGIECPNAVDVVFGKGQMNQNHSGNRGMQALIAQNYVRHYSASKVDKTCITHLIHYEIEENGGRFLKRNESLGYWIPVAKEDALKKIAKGFRDYRRKKLDKNDKSGVIGAPARATRFLDAVLEALAKRRKLD